MGVTPLGPTGSSDQGDSDAFPPGKSDLVWHRMHPITPVLKTWKFITAVLVIIGFQVQDHLSAAGAFIWAQPWIVIAGFVALALAGLGATALSWRMTRFAVGNDAIHVSTGVLFRQQRQVKLDRLQTVELVRPLLAQLGGLAELRLEVAGGTDSQVSLAYIREDDANRLRAELMGLAAGLRPTGVGTDAEVFPTAPEQTVYELSAGRLVASIVLSGAIFGVIVGIAAPVAFVVWSDEVVGLLAVIPALIGAVGAVWAQANRSMFFRVATSPDGIRLRRGLTESRAQTVPPGRVQALRLRQSLLWRGPGWWQIEVNIAGLGSEQDHVLHPVATRGEAGTAVGLVFGFIASEVLDQALSGRGDIEGFVPAPRRAMLLDPMGWRRLGFAVTDQALIFRTGRLRRQTVIVPHEKTQALEVYQGPLQRLLRVATFELHSTGGPVRPVLAHLDQDVAVRLFAEQATRARNARAGAPPEKWMSTQEGL